MNHIVYMKLDMCTVLLPFDEVQAMDRRKLWHFNDFIIQHDACTSIIYANVLYGIAINQEKADKDGIVVIMTNGGHVPTSLRYNLRIWYTIYYENLFYHEYTYSFPSVRQSLSIP